LIIVIKSNYTFEKASNYWFFEMVLIPLSFIIFKYLCQEPIHTVNNNRLKLNLLDIIKDQVYNVKQQNNHSYIEGSHQRPMFVLRWGIDQAMIFILRIFYSLFNSELLSLNIKKRHALQTFRI
jgi:hypothetical protein